MVEEETEGNSIFQKTQEYYYLLNTENFHPRTITARDYWKERTACQLLWLQCIYARERHGIGKKMP